MILITRQKVSKSEKQKNSIELIELKNLNIIICKYLKFDHKTKQL